MMQSIHIRQNNELQIQSNLELQPVSHLFTTQGKLPMNVMFFAMKLQKLRFFSAVSLYTQLSFVLHRNHPNIKDIPITISFPVHVPTNFIIYHPKPL